jgi:hypothetical protein
MLTKLTVAAGLMSASVLFFHLGRRHLKRRTRGGIEWSDNGPKPPFSHNIER